jgi:hypothetical protein
MADDARDASAELPTIAAELAGWPIEWFADQIAASCVALPLGAIEPVMKRYIKDERNVALHYPWVAFAVAGYRKCLGRGKDARDLTPKQMEKMLGDISKNSRTLFDELDNLEEAIGGAASNGNLPKWRAFARAKQQLLLAFGSGGSGLYPSSVPHPDSRSEMVRFEAALLALSNAAKDGASLIARDKQRVEGVDHARWGSAVYIGVLSAVWSSATGRRPSAEKVETVDNTDPPFVRFANEIAAIAGLPTSSRKAVAGILDTKAPL